MNVQVDRWEEGSLILNPDSSGQEIVGTMQWVVCEWIMEGPSSRRGAWVCCPNESLQLAYHAVGWAGARMRTLCSRVFCVVVQSGDGFWWPDQTVWDMIPGAACKAGDVVPAVAELASVLIALPGAAMGSVFATPGRPVPSGEGEATERPAWDDPNAPTTGEV